MTVAWLCRSVEKGFSPPMCDDGKFGCSYIKNKTIRSLSHIIAKMSSIYTNDLNIEKG